MYFVSSTKNTAYQVVPSVDSSYDGRELMIYVQFANTPTIETGIRFVYRAAAKITSLTPLDSHAL